MPPKRNTARVAIATPKKDKTLCDLCCLPVVEGKDDAVLCEGSCQAWLHRRCAGVPYSYFKRDLINSSTPFVCAHCSQKTYRADVCQLQDEVNALRAEVSELRAALEATRSGNANSNDTITALASEVQQMKIAMSDAPSTHTQTENAGSQAPWRDVVRRGKRKPRPRQLPKDPASANASVAHNPKNSLTARSNRPSYVSRDRIQVKGARKIWGTVKTTTKSAIESTIKTLTTVPSSGLIYQEEV